jgi:hypothetical protein
MVAYHTLLVTRSHASPSTSKQILCHYGDYSSLVTSAVVNDSKLVHHYSTERGVSMAIASVPRGLRAW